MESAAEFGRLAMFPLQSAFLPGEDLPLQIFEPRYAEMVRDCMRDNNPRFGTVLISQGREVGGGDMRCDVGTLARIAECVEIAGSGRFMLRCKTAERIKVCEWLPDDPYPRAVVEVQVPPRKLTMLLDSERNRHLRRDRRSFAGEAHEDGLVAKLGRCRVGEQRVEHDVARTRDVALVHFQSSRTSTMS